MRPNLRRIQENIISTAGRLISNGQVDLVLGYTASTLPLHARPGIVRTVEDATELVFDASCGHNLTVYLPRLLDTTDVGGDGNPQRVGIVVKGCDARSLVVLVQEKQLPRENVIILGVPCTGVLDHQKIAVQMRGAEPIELAFEGDNAIIMVDHRGRRVEVQWDDILRDACLHCPHPTPVIYDELMDEPVASRESGGRFAIVESIEQMNDTERFARFHDEIARCIRCNACRQACPNCYCTECFALRSRPQWTTPAAELSDIAIFHLGRLLHQAGRCVDCGACVAACPMDIDLRPYSLKITREIAQLFDAEAGLSPERLAVLCTFRFDDDQSFMIEP